MPIHGIFAHIHLVATGVTFLLGAIALIYLLAMLISLFDRADKAKQNAKRYGLVVVKCVALWVIAVILTDILRLP